MDKNAPATTTYPRYIPARLGLARHFGDTARPGWRRPSGPRLVPHFAAFLPTEAGRDGPELLVPCRAAGSSPGKTCEVSYTDKG